MYPTYSQLWDADIERSMLFPFNREFFLQSLLSFPGLKIIWPFQETSGSVALATNDALALGRELVINGDFANWTGDDPDSWTVSGEVGADPEISEVGSGQSHGGAGTGACNLFSSATDTQPRITQTNILAVGKTFQITTVISAISGTIRITSPTVGFELLYDSIGTKVDVITADNTSLLVQGRFSPLNATIDSISVRQTDIAASTAFPGAEELSEAGASGTATAANWGVLNAVVSNPSGGVLRVTATAAFGRGTQDPFTIGKRYRITGEVRSDGVTGSRVANGPATLASYVASTNWDSIDIEAVMVNTELRLMTITDAQYTEWRNISVTEANPLNGDIIGCTIGQPSGLPGLPYLYSSEGISNYVDIHCAELNSMLDPASDFSIAIVGQSDTWVAGIDYLLRLAADANNSIEIYRSGTDLVAVFVAGGIAETIIITSGSPSTPFIIEITREGNDFSAYYNGVLDSTETIAGAYVGNLDSTLCAVGAKNITPTNVWAGDYGIPYIFFTRARNADEIAQTAKLLGL